MSPQTFRLQDAPSMDKIEVRALYKQWLDCWNKRNAHDMAAPCAEDGKVVGFDASPLNVSFTVDQSWPNN
jgi:hypothetical protein